MVDEPLTLSPLDPRRDVERFDARVRSIVRDTFERRSHSVYLILGAWTRATMIAAALMIAVSLSVIVNGTPQRSPTTAEILGVPTALIDVVVASPNPMLDDLANALNAGGPHGY